MQVIWYYLQPEYMPIIKKMLESYRANIHGMVHCSGGNERHFVDGLHVIKDNLRKGQLIHEQSGTDWKEIRYSWGIAWKPIYLQNLKSYCCFGVGCENCR